MEYTVQTQGMHSLRFTPSSLKVRKAPRNQNNSFHLLYKTSLALGIPIAPLGGSRHAALLAKAWCLTLFLHKTVTALVSFSHAYRILPSFASLFAFYFFDSFSYISMLALFAKRGRIYSATRASADLAARMDPGAFVGSRGVPYQILSLVVFSVAITSIFATFFFHQEWEWCMRTLRAPPPIHQHTYVWVVLFCIVSHHAWTSATCFLAVLLCYNSFVAAGGPDPSAASPAGPASSGDCGSSAHRNIHRERIGVAIRCRNKTT